MKPRKRKKTQSGTPPLRLSGPTSLESPRGRARALLRRLDVAEARVRSRIFDFAVGLVVVCWVLDVVSRRLPATARNLAGIGLQRASRRAVV